MGLLCFAFDFRCLLCLLTHCCYVLMVLIGGYEDCSARPIVVVLTEQRIQNNPPSPLPAHRQDVFGESHPLVCNRLVEASIYQSVLVWFDLMRWLPQTNR